LKFGLTLVSTITESKVWSQQIAETKRKKLTSLFADLWSQSVYWTQQWSQ